VFNKIFVGYDGAGRSEDALSLARRLARIGPGTVTAVYVYGYRRSTRISSRSGEFAGTLAHAERMLALLRESVGDEIDVRPMLGFSAAGGLQQLAEEEGADLIVVGSTARGRKGRTFPGTTADRLLNGAPCAVAVVPLGYRDQVADSLRRVGAAYCRVPEAATALRAAHAIARASGAALEVVSAFDAAAQDSSEGVVIARKAAEAGLDQALEHVADGVSVSGELADGPAVDVLRERSAGLDLLVMGSRAHGPIRRALVGSTSHGLLLDCLCPVLVVPRGVPSLTEAPRPDRARSSG
jgi:nucleotide-binding universal stress UspA family protein